MMHQLLYPQEKTQYPLNRRLGGLQSCLGHFGQKPLAPAGIRTPHHAAHSRIIIPTLPSHLLSLQIIHGYINKVRPEKEYISVKTKCYSNFV
jgi:hypothetical protein